MPPKIFKSVDASLFKIQIKLGLWNKKFPKSSYWFHPLIEEMCFEWSILQRYNFKIYKVQVDFFKRASIEGWLWVTFDTKFILDFLIINYLFCRNGWIIFQLHYLILSTCYISSNFFLQETQTKIALLIHISFAYKKK